MQPESEVLALLRQFLRNPGWVRMLHDEDCLWSYDPDDPESCKCDGSVFEESARAIFPELSTKEYLD